MNIINNLIIVIIASVWINPAFAKLYYNMGVGPYFEVSDKYELNSYIDEDTLVQENNEIVCLGSIDNYETIYEDYLVVDAQGYPSIMYM